MKLRYILLTAMLALAIALCGCAKTAPAAPAAPAAPTETAAPEAPQEEPLGKELQAYQAFLETAPAIEGEPVELQEATFDYEQNVAKFGNHIDHFALVDLDGDGQMELITATMINNRWVPISVYTYADGAVVMLKDPLDEASQWTFTRNSSAAGAYFTYICKDGHIHNLWRGDTPIGEVEENNAYVLSGTKLTAVDCSATEANPSLNIWDITKDNTAENRAAICAK